MSWRAVRINEEVHACRPNTCQWRAAKVVEDANQSQHSAVRVKFVGDTAVHCIPWASIKLYQYPKSGSLFSTPVVSRSKNPSSKKIVSIDLTQHDDIPDSPVRHHGATKHNTHNRQIENGHIHSPPREKQRTSSRHQKGTASILPILDSLASHSSRAGSKTLAVRPPSTSSNQSGISPTLKDSGSIAVPCNEIVWEWNPILSEERIQTSSEIGSAHRGGNTPNGSVLRINDKTDIKSKPLERHPVKGVEDIPIPRNSSKSREGKVIDHEGESLRGKVRSVNWSVVPSKRPRSSHDAQSELVAVLPLAQNDWGVSHRILKKQRRGDLQSQDSVLEREKARAKVRKSPNNVLHKFQPIARFPFGQGHEEIKDADKDVNKSCAEMVSEHRNEVKAMLQALDNLKLTKKPPRIQNRSGRRKSANPKSWGHRELTEQIIFHNANVSYAEQGTVGGSITNSCLGLAGNSQQVRCMCGAVDVDGGTAAGHPAVQCEVCRCLTHVKCMQCEDKDLGELGIDRSANATRFVCSFCVDDATDYNVAEITAAGERQDPMQCDLTSGRRKRFPGYQFASVKGQAWQSDVAPVVTVERKTKPPHSRSRRKASMTTNRTKYRPRSPLTESEVEARALNIDFLRAGVLKQSVGSMEQKLIDSKISTFRP